MNLRKIAEADLGNILEDKVTGFGVPIRVKDPDGCIAEMTGFSNDITQMVDLDTGQVVSGRSASVILLISSFKNQLMGVPRGITDSKNKPWLVEFEDISGETFTFKVAQSNPDRSSGQVTLILEVYE